MANDTIQYLMKIPLRHHMQSNGLEVQIDLGSNYFEDILSNETTSNRFLSNFSFRQANHTVYWDNNIFVL